MTNLRSILGRILAATLVAGSLLSGAALAQGQANQPGSKSEQWIHVRVESKEDRGETVRVNVPMEMAVKVLPAIHQDRLHDGKVRIEGHPMKDVDLQAILDAVRTSRDGEYVTVQSNENDVRVAKKGEYLYIHITDKESSKKPAAKDGKQGANAAATRESKVEVKVPMKVVDALFSAGNDELDVLAALRALSAHGDTELVTVKDDQNTVRIWVDSKNIAD
jgi:hypothetical protein